MDKLDKVVAQSRKSAEKRGHEYRDLALKMYPWICGKCSREFTRENVIELTVHHRDHNHDNNPPDGSNWENLCLYCHDNEHARYVDAVPGAEPAKSTAVTHKGLAGLADLLKKGS